MSKESKVLICGVNSQDGAYLSEYLLGQKFEVHGTSRDVESSSLSNLYKLNIRSKVFLHSMDPRDFRSVFIMINSIKPDYIFNLAAQSSVGLSFSQPFETYQSNVVSSLNIFEAVRLINSKIKIFNACSSEMFGSTGESHANELTSFKPLSPYAISKASSFWTANYYREAFDMFICNGILFNHESPLRPERFVTQKIIKSALRISKGSDEKLVLGNLNIKRDWGWAPEFIEAMWKIICHEVPDDYIVATGKTFSLESFVDHAFTCLGLNWKDHVEVNKELLRPLDLETNRADISKIVNTLGWVPKVFMPEIVERLIDSASGEIRI